MRTLIESILDDNIKYEDIKKHMMDKYHDELYNIKNYFFNPSAFKLTKRHPGESLYRLFSKLPTLFIKENIRWTIEDNKIPMIRKILPSKKLENFYILFYKEDYKGEKIYNVYIYNPHDKYNSAQIIRSYTYRGKLEYLNTYKDIDAEDIISFRISPVLNDWVEDIINKF